MVKISILRKILVILACFSANQANAYTSLLEKNLTIKSVEITYNGFFYPDMIVPENSFFCLDFELTEKDVFDFFQFSNRTNDIKTHEKYNRSQCFSSGFLEFENGEGAYWKIYRSRKGYIFHRDIPLQEYFCKDCKSPPYYEYCDSECKKAWVAP